MSPWKKGLSCRHWCCVIPDLLIRNLYIFLWLLCLMDCPVEMRALKTGAVTSCVFQTAGRRSFAAPSDGAQRPASPSTWGTEWHGKAARTQLTAAPTQTALMEREYPTSDSSTHQTMHIQYPSLSSLFCFFSLSFVFPTTRLGPESQFSDFLDGLGPAQIVGRQTLATPPMGKPSGIDCRPTTPSSPVQSISFSSSIVWFFLRSHEILCTHVGFRSVKQWKNSINLISNQQQVNKVVICENQNIVRL